MLSSARYFQPTGEPGGAPEFPCISALLQNPATVVCAEPGVGATAGDSDREAVLSDVPCRGYRSLQSAVSRPQGRSVLDRLRGAPDDGEKCACAGTAREGA